uniref:Ribosomal protein S8 n=1 Tax=Proteomonas sulcata TaxID=77928 RepID=A0A2P1G8C6_9CRYP|nr:ribosomal protein S8 [Proteomonas sulcata]AVM81212.1 ribosomal protein S8 [Proteomonas sulcata]
MQINTIFSLLTNIRNSQKAGKNNIIQPYTKTLFSIVTLLYNEGFVRGFFLKRINKKKMLCILIKYKNDLPTIKEISAASFPKSNFNIKKDELVKNYNGKGLIIMSTTKGIITNETAFKYQKGGKILFKIK